jgi:hypothetical protein
MVCLALLVPCQAEEQSKFELFGGYSRMRTGFAGPGQDHAGLNGWNASVARNMNMWFGLKADFGGHYGSSAIQLPLLTTSCPPDCLPEFHVETKTHEFLFGPQFTYRTEMVRAFAHVLIGAEHVNVSSNISGQLPLLVSIAPLSVSTSKTGFATAIGGGFDLGGDQVALRFQPDLVITHLFNRTQYDPRIGVGLVVRF